MYDAMQQNPMSESFFKAGEGDHAKARFYKEAVQDIVESEKQGMAIYGEVDFVEIRHPGDRSYSWVGAVEEEHKQRWPAQYKAFVESAGEKIVGTPINQYPPLTKADMLNLQSLHITTVEDLATVPDATIDKLGHGGRKLRDEAMSWLQAAEKGKAGIQAAAENARLKEQLAAMQAQIDALSNGKTSRRRAEEEA